MTKQEAEKWLYDNQSQEGSPEFERVFALYKGLATGGADPLKAAQVEYDTINAQADSPEKLAALDRLRTKIESLGGKPKLSDSSMVSGRTEEAQPTEKPVEKPAAKQTGLPSQEEFDEFVREARKAQLMGGAAASLKYAPEVAQRVLAPTVGALSQAAAEGRMRARPPSSPPSPSSSAITVLPAQTGALSVVNQPSAVLDPRAPVQPTADQVTRQIQGTIKEPGTSMATTGRASQTTYQNRSTDIKEAKQAQQAALEALGKKTVLGPVPQGITASSPSGILVPQSALEPRPPGPMIGPMATGPQGPSIGPPTGPSGPQINPQTLRELPMSSTAARPPVRSGLDQIRGAFTSLANSPLGQKAADAAKLVGKGVGAVGTVAAGAETGLNLYDMVDALQKDDYKRAALAGAKAAATGAMIMTPYGLIPAAAIYGTEWLNDATARAKMKALHGMSPQNAYESEGGFYVTPQ